MSPHPPAAVKLAKESKQHHTGHDSAALSSEIPTLLRLTYDARHLAVVVVA